MPAVTGSVRPIYLVASDTPAADMAAHADAFARAMVGIQQWYAEAMGAAYFRQTFRVERIQVLKSHYTRAQWDDFGVHGFLYPDGSRTPDGGSTAMWYAAQFELDARGLLADAGLPALFSMNTAYVVVGGGGHNGSGGVGRLAAVEEAILDLQRVRCPDGRNDACALGCPDAGLDCDKSPDDTFNCASVGAMAHEMGHGFGLPHGTGRTGSDRTVCLNQTLMDVWWSYDYGPSLCDPDRRDLANSGFFGPLP
jgi:hypothetical protein